MKRDVKVFVSGTGIVSPNGIGVDEFWENSSRGRSGIKKINFLNLSETSVKIAGFISNSLNTKFKHNLPSFLYDRISILTKIAADEAINNSNLTIEGNPKIGIVIGIALSGMESLEKCYKDYYVYKTGNIIEPFLASMPNTPSNLLAMEYGIQGINYTINSACSSSGAAIGLAYILIKNGILDACITGGAEAPLTDATIGHFQKLKVLNTKSNDKPSKASKPFSIDRKGLVLSEGAGILILESEKHINDRNGNKCCEILGYGSSNNAQHIVKPNLEGQKLAVNLALKDASIQPPAVDYIHAHGTSTILNDQIETDVIKAIFGRRAYSIPISSIKSMIGHTLGASAVISAICTIETMKHNFLTPTINLDNPDPNCDLDYTANQGISFNVNIAFVNSFGFGGNNNVILLKKAN